ncbi:MAG: DUF3500 domain-containing protein [Phycisphaerales bacterium]|nr:DUF3500 domain-containing protein [Phycisphaerales bacterium]
MHRSIPEKALLALLVIGLPSSPLWAAVDDGGSAEAVAFIETLDESQKQLAVRPINDPERLQWTFLPGPREGVRLADLDARQSRAFKAFLQAALSPKGYRRVDQLRKVEPVEDRGGGVRTSPDEFWVRFYGDPAAATGENRQESPGAWAWRLEGHHLVLNAAMVDGEVVSVSPLFFGAFPIRGTEHSPEDVRGVEPLRGEDELATALLKSLDPINTAAARSIGPTPGDIRSGTKAKARDLPEAGVQMSRMTDSEKALVSAIVEGYLGTWPESAREKLIESFRTADRSKIRFAWSGVERRDAPHYWRIVSPGLVIEYWNGQLGVNHVHVVVRTRHGEFPGG